MNGAWPPPHLAAFAASLPWEHQQRGLSWAVARARWQAEASTAATTALLPGVGLLMAPGGNCEDWLRTLTSWHLQTSPTSGWWMVGAGEEPWREQREADGLPAPEGCLATVDAGQLAARGVDWALSARAGDLLHPSLAWTIALAARDGCEAVCWDWFSYSESNKGLHLLARHRAPWRDMVRELSTDARGRAFALPIAAWNGLPGHSPWQVRMRARDAFEAVHMHPEPLGMYPEALATSTEAIGSHALQVAEMRWGVPFSWGPDGEVRPATAAASVSVVLMYRDSPELTIRALQSVLAQRFDGDLEVVLVDNGSGAAARLAIEDALTGAGDHLQITRLVAPGAFNHSAQAAMAADAAQGEVLLWLNNDAYLLTEDAIDQLARWALVPRVASVGVGVVDASGAVVGGGMRARRMPGAEFNSPVEEASGAQAALARQVIGNSFACAAVSTTAWQALGGLDRARYPAGYNDVDYCLRAVALGWTHVNLGHVQVVHAVGASRAKQDEIAQKIWLRTQHPWTLVHSLQEASCERIDASVPTPQRLAAASLPPCRLQGGAT